MKRSLDRFSVVAFTHRSIALQDIGLLHIEPDARQERLAAAKMQHNFHELMYLSTCNRVEFSLVKDGPLTREEFSSFLETLFPDLNAKQIYDLVEGATYYNGKNAIDHLLSVASSVDSMVVGEREIITQVREAYEESHQLGLTGDLIRIIVRHTIETAKRVYTETHIARRPVSVVSLAYHKLRDLNVPLDSRILIVGAGITNTNMSRFLKKHGFTNFNVFNRTFSKAEILAGELKGNPNNLRALGEFDKGFDVIITCTGAEDHVITPGVYHNLLQGETDKKIIIDLAIPQDLDPQILNKYLINYISVEVLQEISNKNLKERSKEIQHVEEILKEASFEFDQIYQMREIEIAMREVPNKVKEIKSNAMNEVFKNELSGIDQDSREVVEKIVNYMEKKYMSIPMLMAKDILMKQHKDA